MPSQADFDRAYLDMANTWGQLSKALRRKVGCLIVKDGAIISDGYNGTPSGFNNECEIKVPSPKLVVDDEGQLVEGTYKLKTKPEVLHAESNAITKLAKSTQSSDGATMYITISPCVECSKLIIQSGIKRVVFREFYKSQEAINFLKKANITVEQQCILNSKN
ncbi:MAG: CMP deaminase [Verrucomicrobiales bacterium]|nr:CMP deaminase [Verrucomicrobiales bacterium]|tara:strand:+ start:41502 stop:41990 length:489 start_codon:yes stop_codon:yes gene_type:complete